MLTSISEHSYFTVLLRMLALTAFFFESLTGLGVRAKEQAQCRKSPQRGNILAKLESFFNSSRAKVKIKRRPKSKTRTPPCLSADRSEQRRGRHDAAPKNKQKATVYLSRCFLRDQPDGLLPRSAPVPCAHFHCVTAPGFAVPPRRRGPCTKVSRNLSHGPTAPRSPSPRSRRCSLGPSDKNSPRPLPPASPPSIQFRVQTGTGSLVGGARRRKALRSRSRDSAVAPVGPAPRSARRRGGAARG